MSLPSPDGPASDDADSANPSADPDHMLDWLVLVPTAQERDCLDLNSDFPVPVELCGFGIAAASLLAGRWIDRLRPSRVFLIGIAGAFDPESIGQCFCFRRVGIDGIGARSGKDMLGPREMGLAQLPRGGLNRGQPVFDSIDLATIAECPTRDSILTVCAAAGSTDDAADRRARYPGVFAEEMEGFGVAMACHAAGIPLTIVRGMSNRVGDRDYANWQIQESMAAVRQVLTDFIRNNA